MTEKEKSVNITVDASDALLLFFELHKEKWYSGNYNYSLATRYALNRVIYEEPLSNEEIGIIVDRYASDKNLEEVVISGREVPAQMFRYIFELDRYKSVYERLAAQGY